MTAEAEKRSNFATNNNSLSFLLSLLFRDYHKSIELIIDFPQNHSSGLNLRAPFSENKLI
jgi:hypothetical protein